MTKRPEEDRWNAASREQLRRLVAMWHVKGLRPFEIAELLAQETIMGREGPEPNPSYFVNPATGNPYVKSTIYKMIGEIRDGWRMEDAERVKSYMADCIGNAEEARRAAWSGSDIKTVLAANHQMARLVGAYKPLEININWAALTDEQVERLANGEPIGSVLAGPASAGRPQGNEATQDHNEE